jgi:hypothetical protein
MIVHTLIELFQVSSSLHPDKTPFDILQVLLKTTSFFFFLRNKTTSFSTSNVEDKHKKESFLYIYYIGKLLIRSQFLNTKQIRN